MEQTSQIATTPFAVKVFFQEEFRRFTIPKDCPWEDFKVKLVSALNVAPTAKLDIKYEDDEKDFISLNSALELKEAFTLTKSAGLLKINVSVVSNDAQPTVATTNVVDAEPCVNHWATFKNDLDKLSELGFTNRHINRHVLKRFYKKANGEQVDINKVAECLNAHKDKHAFWKEKGACRFSSGSENDSPCPEIPEESFAKLEELGFTNRHRNRRVLTCFYKKANGQPVDINVVAEHMKARNKCWQEAKGEHCKRAAFCGSSQSGNESECPEIPEESFAKLEELGFTNPVNRHVLKRFYMKANGEPVDINKVAECLTAKRNAWKEWKEWKESHSTEDSDTPFWGKGRCHRRWEGKGKGKHCKRNQESEAECQRPIVSEEKLTKLEELGFTNRWVNRCLLRRFASKGDQDVEFVVTHLKQGKEKQAFRLAKREDKLKNKLKLLAIKREMILLKEQRIQQKLEWVAAKKENNK
eukprot:TRINITY_DN894_c0_g2_i1.p1 TRINITY_DN894_c0_g2~~TRINITY_DN894_c0_g2_i1.p1  ORF type:complete len:470 (-),score=122.74 TRINITY_DN894_c0_g2_i1:72-1481(-)